MAEDKKQTSEKQNNENKITREYTIPLRKKTILVPRYKKANRAVKAIKEFLVKHMKVRDRDTNKVKLDKYINEYIWYRGIKKPPAKVKVTATKDNTTGVVHVELVNIPDKLKHKKNKEEKEQKESQQKAEQKKQEQQSMAQKAQQTMQAKGKQSSEKSQEKEGESDKDSEKSPQKKKEEKEHEKSSIESTQKMEEKKEKEMKHQTESSKKGSKKPPRREYQRHYQT